MRNPKSSRNFSAAVFGMCGVTAALVLKFIAPNPQTQEGWFGVEVVSLLVGFTALLTMLYFQVAHSRREKLRRGVGVLSQWTVSPGECSAYLERELLRADEWPRNTIKLDPQRAPAGAQVLLGSGTLMVDGDFHSLSDIKGLLWLEETPKCIQCNMSTPGKSGSFSWTLRFPVTREAEARASEACASIASARRVPFEKLAGPSPRT